MFKQEQEDAGGKEAELELLTKDKKQAVTSDTNDPATATGQVASELASEPATPILRYTLTQMPPIAVAIFLAIQHVLISLAGALTTSSIVSDTLCADLNHPIRAQMFSTTLFMAGVCTVTQTLIGIRLPVFQGPSSSFLVPLIALSKNTGWICKTNTSVEPVVNYNEPSHNITAWANTMELPSLTLEEKLQQLSGSLMIASLVEVLVGGLGLLKPLVRLIGPLTIAPTIGLIGLSLFKLPVVYAKYNPVISLGSAVLVTVFSLYMSNIKIPIPSCRKGGKRSYFPVFQLLPILVAMVIMWILCGILTVTGAIPDDQNHPSYYTRTDAKANIFHSAPWFHFTYPGQFGYPSFNIAATIGFTAAVMASLIESVGDYYATAKCCQVVSPPDHAMSRGILMEGLGSVLSGAVGAAHATTSYSGNIAMLSLTQTASRSVLVIAGFIMLGLSLLGKVGAALATLPPPILGGILLVVLGLLCTLGMSTLMYADMRSNRNLLVTGIAFLSGLSIPAFIEEHGNMLETGYENADQVIKVVLGTPMFLGGAIAFILDNTVPGTDLERGILAWKISHSGGKEIRRKGNSAASGSNDVTCIAVDDHLVQKTDSYEIQDKADSALTEEDIYSFAPLKNRLSGCLWRFVPFLPPNAIRAYHLPEGQLKD